jgi:hypothetical protein
MKVRHIGEVVAVDCRKVSPLEEMEMVRIHTRYPLLKYFMSYDTIFLKRHVGEG